MSRIVEILSHPHTKMTIATIVAGGVVYYMKKNQLCFYKEKPKKWKKVGVISHNLWIFPIKSCGPIVLNEFECSNLGPENGHLRDRTFMVIRQSNNEFVSARTYPRMVLITPRIKGNIMRVLAPGMDEIQIDIEKLYNNKEHLTVTIWKDEATVIDCGDEAAKWFSKFLLNKDDGFRLIFYPSKEPKPHIVPKGYKFKTADRIDTGSLHDETSYMIMNVNSVEELNSRLEKSVTPLQFRPNFVVKGPDAWDEDYWKFVKIGNDAVFKVIQPCTRCSLTTIDPSSGERNKNEEPLKTLRKYRLFPNISPTSPVLGIHLGLRQAGTIRNGDSVYVSY
ncbi:mitochondrial amidoxime reducing component 2-like isoform X2 [Chironomus tepperi]|uniref:mitochondrial amidoxime reducing component 2-like isoform X2 n=1 Tax=Chironomus tepperi TaxID=113505 RepID=UPI00391F8DFA